MYFCLTRKCFAQQVNFISDKRIFLNKKVMFVFHVILKQDFVTMIIYCIKRCPYSLNSYFSCSPISFTKKWDIKNTQETAHHGLGFTNLNYILGWQNLKMLAILWLALFCKYVSIKITIKFKDRNYHSFSVLFLGKICWKIEFWCWNKFQWY